MKNRTNIRWLTQLALLVAILLVLNYTPLGYLQIGPLSASLLTVPVAIGAMTMGPTAGAILGGVFGATSFIQALEGKSAMGSALFQVSPFGTFVVCFVARVLVGLCAGLIFKALCKALPKKEKLCCFLGGLVGRVDRADRAEFIKILLGPEVGAVYLRQIDDAFIHSEGTLFQLNSQWPSLMVMTP